jgi:phosphatidylserine decarboxylase
MKSIEVWDRKNMQVFHEQVLGEAFVKWAYVNPLGRWLTQKSLVQQLVSKTVGTYERSRFSKSAIGPFVKSFKISFDGINGNAESFSNFDDFFTRKMRNPESRFSEKALEFCSPCEARLSVFRIENQKAPMSIKGQELALSEFVGPMAPQIPSRGWLWVFRLCPSDYHRFHFFDSGRMVANTTISGQLDSVNPWALSLKPDIFLKNYRQVSMLDTDNFGRVLMAEVGAFCVGRIVNSHTEALFGRGQEKGYFRFGASTVVLLTSDRVQPDQDIIDSVQTRNCESKVSLGERIGQYR